MGDSDPITSTRPTHGELRLRRWPPPELPERPYPVLLPYSHPALLAGRERELAGLRRRLRLPVLILGLSAPSGAGKSSLLMAGLVSALRAEGRPVALARHPHERGLADRLLGDLRASEGALDSVGEDPAAFVDLLLEIERLADGEPPVLVLDQFEDVLRRPDAGPSRAVLGVLLAATARRRPGREDPPCRWLLAFRQEHHGDVMAWLHDVLQDAPAGLSESLPHDLSTPDRCHCMSLPALATPLRGTDPLDQAAEVFQAAIEKPLAVRSPDGRPRYPWRFAGDGAARLARAFAETRLACPDAPLTPELQVVLAHLLAQADDGVVEVPAEPGRRIDEALEDHLRRALEAAFPVGPGAGLSAEQGRARALLALRELAGATGHRDEGLPPDVLSRALGPGGEEILDKLATPFTRLVVLREDADGWRYTLSHDRMAEVVVRMVDQEGRHGKLGVDAELLALRRFVTLHSALYQSREEEQATRLPRGHYRRIETHAEALLWDAERRQWWAACRRRWKLDGRRTAVRALAAILVLVLVGAATWSRARRLAEERALAEQIADGEPEAAFQAFDRLASEPGADPEKLRSWLRRRESPLDVLEHGMGGVGKERRSAAVVRAVEIALPLLDEAPDDPVLIANLVWALDYAPCRDPLHVAEARGLRDRVLEPLRRLRPPPPVPGPGDPDWSSLPGGTFRMGTEPGDWDAIGPDLAPWIEAARPRHQVTVAPFRMLKHEVTVQDFRRLYPDHPGTEDFPAGGMTWYEGVTYAAWLGGRLPTEAEWEFAARARCPFAYCTQDGQEATGDQVAWTSRNATDPVTREPSVRPVMQLEPNQWGLFDMYGNVNEGLADWFGPYSSEPQVDPAGPTRGPGRIGRSGNYHMFFADGGAWGILRAPGLPSGRSGDTGFRVVLPACR